MQQAFEGIIDASGLCSLRQDNRGDYRSNVSCSSMCVQFWAVLDTQCATQILRELLAGNRRRALALLEETATTLGSKMQNV